MNFLTFKNYGVEALAVSSWGKVAVTDKFNGYVAYGLYDTRTDSVTFWRNEHIDAGDVERIALELLWIPRERVTVVKVSRNEWKDKILPLFDKIRL